MSTYTAWQLDRVRLVAIVHGVIAMFLFGLALLVSTVILPTRDANPNQPAAVYLVGGATALLGLLALAFALSSLFIFKAKHRWLSLVLSVLLLPLFPVGTIVGVACIFFLTSAPAAALYQSHPHAISGQVSEPIAK